MAPTTAAWARSPTIAPGPAVVQPRRRSRCCSRSVPELLGGHMHLHLLLTVALGALMSLALYALVRELRAPPWLGLLLALLAFVYPLSDANRLWPAAGWNNFAVACYFAGATLALRGLRSRAVANHAAAFVAVRGRDHDLRADRARGGADRRALPAAHVAARALPRAGRPTSRPRCSECCWSRRSRRARRSGTTAEKLHHAGVIAQASRSRSGPTRCGRSAAWGARGGLVVLALLVALVAWRAPRRLAACGPGASVRRASATPRSCRAKTSTPRCIRAWATA